MSDSVRPQRWQPTRLPCPWDSLGKNTGVGCHFLLQCMKVKSESEVTQSCPTPSDPMDCSLPGSSFHGIFPGKSTGVGCHCLLCLLTELRYKIPGCDNRCRCVEQGLAGRRSQRSTCSPLHPGLDHLGGEAACSQLSQRRPAFS